MNSAIRLATARSATSEEKAVYTRVGGREGSYYLDLCDGTGRVVEIDKAGWRVLSSSPVSFQRRPGALPLPVPDTGGSIDDFRQFCNVSDSDFILIISFVLAALRPASEYPALALRGEQGSSKSSLAGLIRSLVDPNTSPLRSSPTSEEDLMVSAGCSHLLVWDNVSDIQKWLSDAACRVATGGGFSKRRLYRGRDEELFYFVKPVIWTSIEHVVTRQDLLSRCLCIEMEPISSQSRLTTSDLDARFSILRPRILGALLDAIACGLRQLGQTKLLSPPRMAETATWATACETAYAPAGSFMAAWEENAYEAVLDTLDADIVASSLLRFMDQREIWTGTAAKLLRELSNIRNSITTARLNEWPTIPNRLSQHLTRLTPGLKQAGIEVVRYKAPDRHRTRMVELRNAQLASSASSASSARAQQFGVDDYMVPTRGKSSDRNPDDADDADDQTIDLACSKIWPLH